MTKKAPGKHYRKGVTITQLIRMFPDNATAEAWFIQQRWPNGVHCPKCESDNIQERASRKPQPYRCRSCRKDFSAKTGTLMQGSNLDFQKWAIAIYLMTTGIKGVSSMRLHQGVGHHAEVGLVHGAPDTGNLGRQFAAVHVDPWKWTKPTLAGSEKNQTRCTSARKGLRKAARARPSWLVAAKDRATRQISADVVPNAEAVTLHAFVAGRAKHDAMIYTDDHSSYRKLPYRHESVKAFSQRVCAKRPSACTNGIESFWALLKRGYHGTFHHFSPKHLAPLRQ